jgi:autoinducer 2 (AI-2) kinase
VGVIGDNEAAVFCGSFWQYEYNTGSAAASPQCDIRVNCHAVDAVWQYEALAFNPGLVMRWYRDAFCQEEQRLAVSQGSDAYVLMDAEAQKIPAGSYGMICAYSDVMNFIAWRHAAPAFSNFELDPGRFNKYTFYRAIMENTALVTRGHLLLVEQATGKRPDSVVFAGGAAKSAVWPQILADVLGIPVRIPVVKEATALGAALLAGTGIGMFADLADASRKLVKIERELLPDAANHETYKKAYDTWKNAYAGHLALSDAHVTKYMWRAPGL